MVLILAICGVSQHAGCDLRDSTRRMYPVGICGLLDMPFPYPVPCVVNSFISFPVPLVRGAGPRSGLRGSQFINEFAARDTRCLFHAGISLPYCIASMLVRQVERCFPQCDTNLPEHILVARGTSRALRTPICATRGIQTSTSRVCTAEYRPSRPGIPVKPRSRHPSQAT